MTNKYEDILNMEYPLKSSDKIKHPPMSIADRAKIFAPFAALKGHEEAIIAKQKIVVPRKNLSEESKEVLDRRLSQIGQSLSQGKHPMITVVYFQKDTTESKEEEEGVYLRFTGLVGKYDPLLRTIQIVDKKLKLDDIYGIEGEQFSTEKIL